MLQVSRAYEESSLETLRKVLQKYRTFLEDDKIIARNLKSVSDTLLEQNIRRIIEPYSCIEISFIAGKLQMDQYILEKTLTKLILDKKILGVIDQSKGHLILFKQKTLSPVYEDALAAIEQLTMIVTKLSQNID
ncbi:26S proteasome regulatory subunit rpn6, variant 2 [Bonamia ostreae]